MASIGNRHRLRSESYLLLFLREDDLFLVLFNLANCLNSMDYDITVAHQLNGHHLVIRIEDLLLEN